MATVVYFVNEKSGTKYRVISIDKAKGTITLKGHYDPFVEKYSKERFETLGYKPVKVEEDASQTV